MVIKKRNNNKPVQRAHIQTSPPVKKEEKPEKRKFSGAKMVIKKEKQQ